MVLEHPALEFLLVINFQNFAYEEGCDRQIYKGNHYDRSQGLVIRLDICVMAFSQLLRFY